MFTSFFTAICPTYIYLRSVATWSAETSFRYITGCRHGERLRSPRKYGEQADNINLCASKVSSSADIVTSVNSSFYKRNIIAINQIFDDVNLLSKKNDIIFWIYNTLQRSRNSATSSLWWEFHLSKYSSFVSSIIVL